ncbi:TonB-dependent siderophore receptor [Bradyrhizobium sp. USDA 10063]
MSATTKIVVSITLIGAAASVVARAEPAPPVALDPIVVTAPPPPRSSAKQSTQRSTRLRASSKRSPPPREERSSQASRAGKLGSQEVTEGTGDYTARAITVGSKIPVSPREVPQSVSVVSQQQIKEQNLVTLSDALQQTPGVTVVNNNTFMSTFFSRGFALTTVQQDGVPLEYANNQAYGPFDLAMYDSIQVLRGPSGLFTGAGQPSGTINLIRKRALSQFSVRGDVSVGSFDFYRGMLDVTGPLNKAATVRGRFVTSFQDNDYFYDTSHNRNALFYGTVEADLTPDTMLRVGASYQKNDAIPMGGLPAYSNGKLLDVPRSTFVGAAWGKRPAETANPFFEFTHQFENDWKFRAAGDYFYQDTDWLRAYPTGPVNPLTNNFPGYYGVRTLYTDKQTSLDTSLSGPLHLFGRTHELVFGFNWRNEDYLYTPGATILIPGAVQRLQSFAEYSAAGVASLSIENRHGHDTVRRLCFGQDQPG